MGSWGRRRKVSRPSYSHGGPCLPQLLRETTGLQPDLEHLAAPQAVQEDRAAQELGSPPPVVPRSTLCTVVLGTAEALGRNDQPSRV